MPKTALSPTFLRSVRPPSEGQVEHADGGCPGLQLPLSHGGSATWVLGCRDREGRARRFTLGAFPAIGLARAREMAREQREQVRQGSDPIREAKQLRAQANAAPIKVASLSSVLDGYAKDIGKGAADRGTRRGGGLKHVFAVHLSKPANAITGPELQLTVDGHPSRSSAGAAVRYVRPVLKWAAKRGLVARGISVELDQPEGALGVPQVRPDAG